MNRKIIFTFLAASLLAAATANADGDRRIASFADRHERTDPKGCALLRDVMVKAPGYEKSMEQYLAVDAHSVVVPQIVYAHAMNRFDDGDYAQAHEYMGRIHASELEDFQEDEFLFKQAYSAMKTGRVEEAVQGFKDLERRPMTECTVPARYFLGYMNYERRNFEEACSWFMKATSDERFSKMAKYYVTECRFMLKDYKYVTDNDRVMYDAVSDEMKPHLARIISEAWLVTGDVDKAKEFYELGIVDGNTPDSRGDWFYSGSVLYAAGDYAGAIRSFSNMTERMDSLGQIANYHLAYSYIQTKNKVAAMEAFKDAAQVWYDKEIAEDAYFNWAKLAFDVNSDTSVFNDYIDRYPAKEQEDRINAYIAVAALYDRDYEAAVNAYDRIDELDADMTLNYMKANYLRANQLIASGSYRKAIPCLKTAAYYSDKASRFNQLSRYWLAESYYRNDQFDDAMEVFEDLYNNSALYGRPESYLLPYNMAFTRFMKGDYDAALKWFDSYLQDSGVQYRKEALVRKGDCYFMTKRYSEACAVYDVALKDYFDVNDIYPYYQAAMSYGFAKKPDTKIELLSNVLNASPETKYYPEALFELGRSHVAKENDDQAFECFRKLASTSKDSTFVAKAYIEMGSLSRNQSQYNDALGYYKTVVEKMPHSGYAEDALAAIESIYQTRNEPEKYLEYIESVGAGGTKTEDEKELMFFTAAEQIYLSENYEKALTSLQGYLEKYPDGANAYKADFYMAESYRSLARYEQACDSYRRVIEKGDGSFVEISMLNFSNLSYNMEKWDDAFGGYSSLYAYAKLDNNKRAAALGMMRSAFSARNWSEAVRNSDRILADSGAEADVKTEARYVKAKSYLATSRRDEAYMIFGDLADDPSTAYGAEASYLMILDCYDQGDFEAVKDKVYALSDAGTGQVYWLAKSFIVLGDSFVELDEYEQAKATFESVRNGYEPSGNDDDVMDNVLMRLKKLAELMGE